MHVGGGGLPISMAGVARYRDGYCNDSTLIDNAPANQRQCLADPADPDRSVWLSCTSTTTYDVQLFLNNNCSGLPAMDVRNSVSAQCLYTSPSFGLRVDCTTGMEFMFWHLSRC